MRRSLLFALVTVVLSATGALTLSAGAGAGENIGTTIVIRKVVVGTGTGSSTVHVVCTDSNEVLDVNFDAAGHPTTSVPSNGAITIVNGAWQISSANPPNGPIPCTFTETATGGATSTSWTCAYSSTAPPTPTAQGPSVPEVMLGCAAASGFGVGPATVTYGNLEDNVETQMSTVTFTNQFVATPPTIVADPVVVSPAFTG